jgi:uncharacterized protein YkwD
MIRTADVRNAHEADSQTMFGGTWKLVGAAAVAAVLSAGSTGALAASSAPRTQAGALSALESGVLADMNAIRRSHGLAPLRLSAPLTAAAKEHSASMATDGYFGHSSADGSAFWKRVQRFYAQGRYGYWSVGENLLWSSPDVDPAGALKLWMNSPEHRANLLTPRWREVGVSAVHAAAAPGTFQGLDVTIVTTDFGVRR